MATNFIVIASPVTTKYFKGKQGVSIDTIIGYYNDWYGKKRQRPLRDIDISLLNQLPKEDKYFCYEGNPRDCFLRNTKILFTSLVKEKVRGR